MKLKKALALLLSTTMTFSGGIIANAETEAADSEASTIESSANADSQIWHAISFGQSTDLNFSSTILDEKIGTNYVWDLSQEPYDSSNALSTEGSALTDVLIESRGGKIASGHDGLTYYYTEVDTDKNFVLTADVTVLQFGPETGATANKQEGAGLMIRDINGPARQDPYVDGFSEYPAASNTVMFYYQANGKVLDTPLNLITYARYGVDDAYGNSSNVSTYSGPKMSSALTAVGNGDNTYATTQTLRLEKTDFGFTGYLLDENGDVTQTFNYDNEYVTSNMMTQLDADTMAVGFFCSRNALMKVENIDLQTSDMTSVDATPFFIKTAQETASLKLSSNTYTNSDSYTLSFLPTHDGTVTVTQDGTVIVENERVTSNLQSAFNTSMPGDTSTYSISYVADADEDPAVSVVNAGETLSYDITVTKASYNTDLYVSPDGNGDGSESSPMNINEAIEKLVPGGKIYMLEGNYTNTITLSRDKSGTAGAYKSLIAVNDNVVLYGGMLSVSGDYWIVDGLTIDGADHTVTNGLMIQGSNNIVRHCTVHDCGDTGIYIKGTSGNGRDALSPSNNLVSNCEAYNNVDASAINADGFAAKLGTGSNNVFEYCVSHDNADDGWDLYNKIGQGINGVTTITNCIAYNNGNNGYKLGGEGIPVAHTLTHSIAYNNGLCGITDNFNPGELTVTNNTAFNNAKANIFITLSPYEAKATVTGNISYKTETTEDHCDDYVYAQTNSSNYLYSAGSTLLSDASFQSLDSNDCYSFNEDGMLTLGSFLRPVANSAIDGLGAHADNTPSVGDDDIASYIEEVAGAQVTTEGSNLIKIKATSGNLTTVLVNNLIIQGHSQSAGWTDEGVAAGLTDKRLEAVRLTIADSSKDVYYRTYVDGMGWLAWAKNGEISGTVGLAKGLAQLQIAIVNKGESAPTADSYPYTNMTGGLSYSGHVQTLGNVAAVQAGQVLGTVGNAKRLEGFTINSTITGLTLNTAVHAQTYGDMAAVTNGLYAGTIGRAKRLEGFTITLSGLAADNYELYYKVHGQTYGWTSWTESGNYAGTKGQAKRVEAIQLVLENTSTTTQIN